jgi:hypothetical protein
MLTSQMLAWQVWSLRQSHQFGGVQKAIGRSGPQKTPAVTVMAGAHTTINNQLKVAAATAMDTATMTATKMTMKTKTMAAAAAAAWQQCGGSSGSSAAAAQGQRGGGGQLGGSGGS